MEEQIYRQPRRSGKKWILIIAAVFVLLLSAVAFVLTANRLSLSVELDGEPEMTLEYGGLEFTVLEVEDRRGGKVKCTRAPELNPENDDDEEEEA